MKKNTLFLLALLLPAVASAFDFQLVVPSGQTLYFDTVPGGVAVVRPNAEGDYYSSWSGFIEPVGALVVPSEVTWQGDVYQVVSIEPAAFYGCDYLTSVVIGQGISSIGTSAFRNCNYIDSIIIPSSVSSIGSQGFGGCTSLSTVWVYSSIPPNTNAWAFYNVNLSSCTLHVPCQSDSTYASAVPWSGFGTIVPMPCAASINLSVNNTARGQVTGGGTYLYGSQVTIEAVPHDGFAFICWNDGDTLNPRLLQATADTHFVAMFFPLIHDTLVLQFHDTTVVHDTTILHDTLVIFNTTYIHDTTVLYDTLDLTPQSFQLQVLSSNTALGLGVGSATLPQGTVAEICALPLEGSRFAGWDDGNTLNPRHITIDGNRTLTALFERVGVSSPQSPKWDVVVEGHRITVRCPQGCQVSLYDATGRLLASATATQPTTLFNNLPSGLYVVSVDNLPARKVVVD